MRLPSRRVGLSRRHPPPLRGPRAGPRPPRPAQGSSGGVDDAQSRRREGPPDHPSSLPWDQLQQAAGRRQRAFGFPPCKSRCRGRRGRKCGSLAGLRVQSASMLSAQRAAQTRPPDGHTGSRPPTLWPVAGSGRRRLRRVVAAAGLGGAADALARFPAVHVRQRLGTDGINVSLLRGFKVLTVYMVGTDCYAPMGPPDGGGRSWRWRISASLCR